jgi:hypothetical protein
MFALEFRKILLLSLKWLDKAHISPFYLLKGSYLYYLICRTPNVDRKKKMSENNFSNVSQLIFSMTALLSFDKKKLFVLNFHEKSNIQIYSNLFY